MKRFDYDAKRNCDVLELVHSDVCGPMSTPSLGGSRYFLTFIDDKTRFVWVYFLKSKDEVFEKFQDWKQMAEKHTGRKLKTLRTDNGGEYVSTKFTRLLKNEGIRHERTVPKTPEQNGVSERMNRTLVEMARSMLQGQSRKLWAEAVNTAAYLRNRSPTNALDRKTPYEAMNGKKPDVSHLREFGCECFVHVPKDERKKFDAKSKKCTFVGYGDAVKGFRVYDANKNKIHLSRDVIFNETPVLQELRPIDTSQTEQSDDQQKPEDETKEEDTLEDESSSDPKDSEETRSTKRERKPVDRFGEWVYTATPEGTSPITYKEAMHDGDSEKWQSAMQEEMESLYSHDVWDLVVLPEGKKAVGSKWVYKLKIGANGKEERHKARLVAQGFNQKYGQDYDETFCPVVRSESIRSIIALAAKENLLLQQLDVSTAFLNGTLEEEVYMKQPEGFVKKGEEHLVCKLKKSIYGLKQSPRCWNTALDSHLKSIGLTQSQTDPCLYTGKEGERILVAVYVDDILVATKTSKTMDRIKNCLAKKFNMKDLGNLKSFLGVQVQRDSSGIWIGQPGYAKKILRQFGMTESNPVSTPVDISQKDQDSENSPSADRSVYQAAVGSLMYLSLWTRPDITYAVSKVARHSANPTHQHWIAVKRILRYLNGTYDRGIKYSSSSTETLNGYSDADWAGDRKDRKSTSGYIFMLSGSPISWRSKKQTCVALSTAEAEYVALSAAAQEAIWLQNLLSELNGQNSPVTIHDDNQAAIAMSKNPQYHGKAKHIAIKFHFIREQVNNNRIKLQYCDTRNMIADIFTKGLSSEQHGKLSNMMNITG